MPRRPPLHTIGASILAIIHNACTRARNQNDPVGSLTKRVTALISSGLPFVYTMQYQCLSFLFIADDYILALENKVEKIFPPSICLFNGIDRLVHDAESLPRKLDDAMKTTLPKIMDKFPFLDWALVHLIAWLNFLISALMLLRSKSAKENGILMDAAACRNSNSSRIRLDSGLEDQNTADSNIIIMQQNDEDDEDELPFIIDTTTCTSYGDSWIPYQERITNDHGKVEGCVESNVLNKSMKKTHANGTKKSSGTMKCSYKEMLEKGMKMEEDPEEETGGYFHLHGNKLAAAEDDSSAGSTVSEERVEIEREKEEGKKGGTGRVGFNLNDPILELYETSWDLE